MTFLSSLIINTASGLTLTYGIVIQYVIHILAVVLIYKASFALAKVSSLREKEIEYWTKSKNPKSN